MRTAYAASLAALLLAPLTTAQVFGGAGQERTAATYFLFEGNGPTHAVNVTYGAPKWKAEYDQMLEQLKGKKARLGKDWWSTLTTASNLEIGGTIVPAGSYVLGIACDADGGFHLLAIDSTKAMKHKWMPWEGAKWKGEISIPLNLHKDSLEDSVEEMEMALVIDQKSPHTGSFSLKWGKHELKADVKLGAKNTVEAGHDGKDGDHDEKGDKDKKGEHGKKGDSDKKGEHK